MHAPSVAAMFWPLQEGFSGVANRPAHVREDVLRHLVTRLDALELHLGHGVHENAQLLLARLRSLRREVEAELAARVSRERPAPSVVPAGAVDIDAVCRDVDALRVRVALRTPPRPLAVRTTSQRRRASERDRPARDAAARTATAQVDALNRALLLTGAASSVPGSDSPEDDSAADDVLSDMARMVSALKEGGRALHDRLVEDNAVLDRASSAAQGNLDATGKTVQTLEAETQGALLNLCATFGMLATVALVFLACYASMKVLGKPPRLAAVAATWAVSPLNAAHHAESNGTASGAAHGTQRGWVGSASGLLAHGRASPSTVAMPHPPVSVAATLSATAGSAASTASEAYLAHFSDSARGLEAGRSATHGVDAHGSLHPLSARTTERVRARPDSPCQMDAPKRAPELPLPVPVFSGLELGAVALATSPVESVLEQAESTAGLTGKGPLSECTTLGESLVSLRDGLVHEDQCAQGAVEPSSVAAELGAAPPASSLAEEATHEQPHGSRAAEAHVASGVGTSTSDSQSAPALAPATPHTDSSSSFSTSDTEQAGRGGHAHEAVAP